MYIVCIYIYIHTLTHAHANAHARTHTPTHTHSICDNEIAVLETKLQSDSDLNVYIVFPGCQMHVV